MYHPLICSCPVLPHVRETPRPLVPPGSEPGDKMSHSRQRATAKRGLHRTQ
jgi:hypothetical protein